MSGRRPAVSGATPAGSRVAQTAVEFAIVLPILLLLILGLVNLGVLITTHIVCTQAAWEGARAGATLTDPAHGDAEIMGAVRSALTGLDADRAEVDIDPTQSEFPRNRPYPMPRGEPLTVSVEYPLTLYVPFPISVPVIAKAVTRMEYQNPP
ncbi:MAG: TadE/TadG family type IV pilus assembly protein [Anaerolineales bacterium]